MSVLPWHGKQWDGLRAALAAGRLPHALLLTGPDGIGLEEFALAFARALLCERAPAPDGAEMPCGECRACVLSRAGNHPDILRVAPAEAGKQIRVDEVRALLEFMHLSSQSGRAKAAIIAPADAMNRNAANGLLKTLEEPPPGAVLMLCSHQPGRLPVTVRSRCQRLDFPGDCGAESCAWLAARLGVSQTAAADLLRRAAGAPFRAVALAESGIVQKQARLVEDLWRIRQQPDNPVPVAQQWADLGFPEVLAWLQTIMRDAAACRVHPAAARNLSSENGHLQRIGDELDLAQLVSSHELASHLYQSATGPFNFNPQGLLEEFIVHWQSLAKERRR